MKKNVHSNRSIKNERTKMQEQIDKDTFYISIRFTACRDPQKYSIADLHILLQHFLLLVGVLSTLFNPLIS
jgi:hypothetical protein